MSEVSAFAFVVLRLRVVVVVFLVAGFFVVVFLVVDFKAFGFFSSTTGSSTIVSGSVI